MKFVLVGLGNPGNEYAHTRHNAGRIALETLAQKEKIEWREDKKAKATVASWNGHTLVLPDTFMNKSGSAVGKYVKSVKAAKNMVVLYDDLDLPLGKIKISFARSSGGHNGLASVARAVKTDEFIRVRIGVSPSTATGKTKKPSGEEKVLKYILGKFSPKDEMELKKVLKRVHEALAVIVESGHVAAMNKFNAQ